MADLQDKIKTGLKQARWRIRRAQAALRWGSEALGSTPAVLGNAMPKSGSHLLSQILVGLTQIGPFVNPGLPPVNRSECNLALTEDAVLSNLRRMRPGDIRYGYLHAREPYLTAVRGPNRATVFLYRDPRDMLVSHVFYATEIHKDHGMHRYYTEMLDSMEERLNAAIEGVRQPGHELSSVRERYDDYLGWLDLPDVLSLRFEDLVLDRRMALERILVHLENRGFVLTTSLEEAVMTLERVVAPQKSGTFRKGEPGEWRKHFSARNKERFKRVAGDLLIRLGYESDDGW
jgi:hypothetical protein